MFFFPCPQPLQAMESYLLVRALCGALGDSLGTAGALCQVTKLLLQLECPSYAQVRAGREGRDRGASSARPRGRSPHTGALGFQFFLEETESCLREADSGNDSYLLLQQTCLLLRSQLCCVNHRVRLLKTPFSASETCRRARGDCSSSGYLSTSR